MTGDPKNKIITDLTIDSRTAGKGSLFICLVGVHTDGHAYIEKAASLGAEAVLVEKDVPPVPGLVMIRVKSTQETMTELAPWFYDYPAQKMRMIGITGTNGKTTTTNILRTLLTNTGHKVCLLYTSSGLCPHHQAKFQTNGQRLHLSAGTARLCVRAQTRTKETEGIYSVGNGIGG